MTNADIRQTHTRGRLEFVGLCRDCGDRSPYCRTAGAVWGWAGDHAERFHGAEWPEVLL